MAGTETRTAVLEVVQSQLEARYEHIKGKLEHAEPGQTPFVAFADFIALQPIKTKLDVLYEKLTNSGLHDKEQRERNDLEADQARIKETIRNNTNNKPGYALAFSDWSREFGHLIQDETALYRKPGVQSTAVDRHLVTLKVTNRLEEYRKAVLFKGLQNGNGRF